MDQRIEQWKESYCELAKKVVAQYAAKMQEEFPDERFPVRPPYRKAMYNYLCEIVDELNKKMKDLLDESPDETDAELERTLMAEQEKYEHEFVLKVRKEDPSSPIKAELAGAGTVL